MEDFDFSYESPFGHLLAIHGMYPAKLVSSFFSLSTENFHYNVTELLLTAHSLIVFEFPTHNKLEGCYRMSCMPNSFYNNV